MVSDDERLLAELIRKKSFVTNDYEIMKASPAVDRAALADLADKCAALEAEVADMKTWLGSEEEAVWHIRSRDAYRREASKIRAGAELPNL